MNEIETHSASDSKLRLAEVVATLSLATDMGTGQPFERALRTCLLAFRLGESLGIDDSELHCVYYVALLRFVGCTADADHLADIFGDELVAQARVATTELLPLPMLSELIRHAGEGCPLPERLRKVAYALSQGIARTREAEIAHCEVSQNIAQRLGLGRDVEASLGQMYERWDGRGLPVGLKHDALSRAIRLVHVAQDAEVFLRIGGTDLALNMARKRAGGFYDPTIAHVFVQHGPRLLAELLEESIWERVLALEPHPWRYLLEAQLDTAMWAIADFTDLRSPYTVGHSSAVAELAFAAAHRCGMSDAEAAQIRRAGYLHDVGRTAISLQIWEKPGTLSNAEWERVRLYPYYTERITVRSEKLAPLGVLAALHRERLDGTGYHRALPASMLPVGARILAAADVYQSKLAARPYRPAWSAERAADELRLQARQGKLDSGAVDAVLASVLGARSVTRRTYPANLSEREVEVLRLMAQGFSTRKIATTLVISPKTADHHIQHIYNKIGVSTRAAATLFAMQNHLL